MTNSGIKTYCINFGVLDVNIAAFTQYIYDSSDIVAYWNHIPLVYCVKSPLRAEELANKIHPFFPRGTFMIAEIDATNLNGRLPSEAWEWFYLDHHKKARPPQLPSQLSLPKP